MHWGVKDPFVTLFPSKVILRSRHFVGASIFLGLMYASTACARSDPPVCLGYDPVTLQWGPVKATANSDGLCAPNFAIVATMRNFFEGVIPVREAEFWGTCCPLPPDALSETFELVENSCPENSVVTGVVRAPSSAPRSDKVHFLLRCHHLRTDRYQLGPVEHGAEFDLTIGAVFYLRNFSQLEWSAPPPLHWGELPPGIRYALGRVSQSEWSWNGCAPYPVGALLTSRKRIRCSALEFRPLIPVSARHDAADAEAVRIYPDCRAIDNPLSPNAKCIKE